MGDGPLPRRGGAARAIRDPGGPDAGPARGPRIPVSSTNRDERGSPEGSSSPCASCARGNRLTPPAPFRTGRRDREPEESRGEDPRRLGAYPVSPPRRAPGRRGGDRGRSGKRPGCDPAGDARARGGDGPSRGDPAIPKATAGDPQGGRSGRSRPGPHSGAGKGGARARVAGGRAGGRGTPARRGAPVGAASRRGFPFRARGLRGRGNPVPLGPRRRAGGGALRRDEDVGRLLHVPPGGTDGRRARGGVVRPRGPRVPFPGDRPRGPVPLRDRLRRGGERAGRDPCVPGRRIRFPGRPPGPRVDPVAGAPLRVGGRQGRRRGTVRASGVP